MLSTPFVEPFVEPFLEQFMEQFLKTMTKVQVLDIANTMPFLGKMHVRLEIRRLFASVSAKPC